ncbi:hypothetical protein D3C87_2001840 [compost metagenome]
MFLNEPMYWNLIAGLLLVTIGILLGVLRKSQGAVPAAAPKPPAAAVGNSAP